MSEGVIRYGFHGLSCESILHQLSDAIPHRLVIAHLGNGASVTAVKAGKSIDNSMGLTPTGGVMMGTRSGDIDPGVLLYLMREKHFNAARLEELVDRRSGLRGVSSLCSDMRDLQAAASSNPAACLAIEMFAYQIRKQIAAMISSSPAALARTMRRYERRSARASAAWASISIRPEMPRPQVRSASPRRGAPSSCLRRRRTSRSPAIRTR
jgi:acetate kinase